MKKIKQIFSYVLGATLVLGGVVFAGSLTPTNTPATSNFVTLSDIYNKLTDNTYSTSTHSVATTTDATETMTTLLDIWNAIPTIEANTIATGTTIMGVTGNITLPATSSVADGVFYGPDNTLEGTLSAGAPALEWSTDYMVEDVPTYVDWATAGIYCTGLGAGWRIPTYIELVAEFLATNPGNTAGFQTDYYWSSTESPHSSDDAYYVNMGYGDADYDNKTSPYFFVRCVR